MQRWVKYEPDEKYLHHVRLRYIILFVILVLLPFVTGALMDLVGTAWTAALVGLLVGAGFVLLWFHPARGLWFNAYYLAGLKSRESRLFEGKIGACLGVIGSLGWTGYWLYQAALQPPV